MIKFLAITVSKRAVKKAAVKIVGEVAKYTAADLLNQAVNSIISKKKEK